MPSRRELLVFAIVAVGASAVTAQDLKMPAVEVQSDPDTDFAALETFGWKDPVSPAREHNVHTSIIWYVERELANEGLRKIPDGVSETPDVFVRYYAKGRSSIQGTPSKSQSILPGGPKTLTTTTSFDLEKVRSGTLILEMQRASDNKVLWRAGSDFRVHEKRIDAEVSRAVDLLFSKYPPPEE